MNTIFERPTLNRKTAEENLALVDRWIADTVDKLNALNVSEGSKKSDNDDVPTKLSELQDDSGHRTVSDTEKASWNNKADKSKVYSTDDQTGTISNNDYMPFSSTSGKKKTLWSDIKEALKTYFDAIYSTFSGSYNDLTDKPTIPAAQIQSDWNQTTTTATDYIKNKPGVVSKQANGFAPQLPNETTTTKYLRQDGTWVVPPNTTYSNWEEYEGSTTVSLCTRGEKYEWNHGIFAAVIRKYVTATAGTKVYIPATDGSYLLSDSESVVIPVAGDMNDLITKPIKYSKIEIEVWQDVGEPPKGRVGITLAEPISGVDIGFLVRTYS